MLLLGKKSCWVKIRLWEESPHILQENIPMRGGYIPCKVIIGSSSGRSSSIRSSSILMAMYYVVRIGGLEWSLD